MNAAAPETSIIIRALNEERWLPEVFAAIHKQKYRDFEVLLVDSGSVDATRDIAAANGARIVRLRSEDFTFGHSLNVGIEAARGKYMALLSAHAIPSDENWLGNLVAPLRRPEVAMTFGGQRGHAVSKFSECRDFERMFPDRGYEVDVEQPFANNANSAVKRELWEKYPFDKGLPGLEDIDWAKYWLERKQKVVYVPDGCIIHVHTETWPQVRRRYYREGMAARWVGIRILRSIPGEVLREVWWGIQDLWLAAAEGTLSQRFGQIVRFRYEKAAGSIGGITDSRGLLNPARRAEAFFGNGFPALVVRGPNRVTLEERNVPSLKPGELLVRVSHVGLTSVDLDVLEGRAAGRGGAGSYPIVPGHESSGTVVAVGPKINGFAEGDRVVVESIQGCGECAECRRDDALRCAERRDVGIAEDGACAVYMVTRARYAHKVPGNVSLAKASLAAPLALVHKGLRRIGSQPQGDAPRRCLVVGAGTIGHLAALVLAARGHEVTVYDAEPARLRAFNGKVQTTNQLNALARYDWLIEATGRSRSVSALLEEGAPGATLLLLGQPYSQMQCNFETLAASDRSVVGSIGSGRRDFVDALAILPQLDTSAFLNATFPLQDYEKAFAAVRARSSLKVLLTTEHGTA
jgi:2-desacetyl-2-hydroxyethyl bacteriochlorophyllide A dehydrogenase